MPLDKAVIDSFEKQLRAYLADATNNVWHMQHRLSERDKFTMRNLVEGAQELKYKADVICGIIERWNMLDGEANLAWEDDRWVPPK